MPFDNLPQTETKADPFELDTLIAWLERQDPAGRYCFVLPGECLLTQYFNTHGLPLAGAYRYGGRELWREHPLVQVAIGFPGTFGAALHRAYALRDERGKSDG